MKHIFDFKPRHLESKEPIGDPSHNYRPQGALGSSFHFFSSEWLFTEFTYDGQNKVACENGWGNQFMLKMCYLWNSTRRIFEISWEIGARHYTGDSSEKDSKGIHEGRVLLKRPRHVVWLKVEDLSCVLSFWMALLVLLYYYNYWKVLFCRLPAPSGEAVGMSLVPS